MAAVEKIEEKRKSDGFFGHRNRKFERAISDRPYVFYRGRIDNPPAQCAHWAPPFTQGGGFGALRRSTVHCQLSTDNYQLSIDFSVVLGYKYSVEIYPFYHVKKL